MVEMLRKRDSFRAGSTNWLFTLWLVAAAPAMLFAADPREARIEMQLQAAIHREVVLGDLRGALDQYRALLAEGGASKETGARALFHIGQCQERLGRRAEARVSYSRVVNEFAGEPPAAAARERLAQWESSLPGPRNIDFSQGTPGQVPPGWFVPALPKDANSYAELRREGCRSRTGCAVVNVPPNAPSPVAHLMQSFSAAAYRGKTVRLRAWLRLEASDPADRAQMMLNVERPKGQPGFVDMMDDRPVRSTAWTRCELVARIDDDATFINFAVIAVGRGLAVISVGRGRVWVDDVSFEIIGR
jgi:hypothetical protein